MSTATETRRVGVTHEPGPYEAGSPASWVRDQLTVAEPGFATLPAIDEARSRLARHNFDIADAIDRGTDYGRQARRMIVESCRGANPEPGYHEQAAGQYLEEVRSGLRDAELRSLTTGGGMTASASGGGGAAVVAPAILLNQLVTYRSPSRAVADQCSPEELPAYGMKISIPNVTTPPSVTVQTEGSPVSDTDPVMGLLTDSVQPFSGQVQVSQQLLDRAGPGISGDKVLFAQLKEMLDAQVDVHVITQILAGAQSVTNNGAFTLTTASGVGGWLGDLKKAKGLTRNTAGTRINSTHAFALGNFCDYVTSYADAQGRPIFSPALDDNRLPIRSVGDQNGESYTGYIVSSLALYSDDNLPNLGTTSQTQVLVARPDTVSLFEQIPIPYCYPPSIAGSMLAICGLRSYAAAIPRYPSGAAVITGTAYNASTFA